MKKLNVLLLMDDGLEKTVISEFHGYSKDASAEYNIYHALKKLGHYIKLLCVNSDIAPIVEQLSKEPPDIVFNLTEQFRGERMMDENISAVLELLNIPFTGTGSKGLMLCRDKGLCKQLLSRRKIQVPEHIVFPCSRPVKISKKIKYPLVVKPLYEDGSDGISNASLVKDENELKERVHLVHENWKQAAIVEEYIEGRELYVSLLGNKRIRVLPFRELSFGNSDSKGPQLATYRVKWNDKYQEKWNIHFCFGEVDAPVQKTIARTCKKIYRILQIKDYGRIDLRLTETGRVVILEANPNPGLGYGDEVAESGIKAGIEYIRLIEMILHSTLRRYQEINSG